MSRWRYRAAPRFWRNFRKLSPRQQEATRKVWQIFKVDPFDARLGTHKINSLSAIFRRTVYAVVVEGDLRVTFYIEGDVFFTTNIGTHDIYKT